MSNPGTFKLTEKETKKIDKELQKEMKQELMFKTKQEIEIFSQCKNSYSYILQLILFFREILSFFVLFISYLIL